jgi:hypothetical protein
MREGPVFIGFPFASAGASLCACQRTAEIVGHLREFIAGVIDHLVGSRVRGLQELLAADHVSGDRQQNQDCRRMEKNREDGVAAVGGAHLALTLQSRFRQL